MDFGVLFLIVVALLMVVGSFMGVASKKPTAPPSEPKPVTVKGADSSDELFEDDGYFGGKLFSHSFFD